MTLSKYKMLFMTAFALLLCGLGLPLFSLSSQPALRVRGEEPSAVARVEGEEYGSLEEAVENWSAGETLTLLADCNTAGITVNEEKALELGDHTLSLSEGLSGSVITSKAALTVRGGTVTGGNAEQGGGIFVDALSSLTLENVTVTGNTASEYGGGVYAVGTLTLKGKTVILDNSDGFGKDSNLFLTSGNKISLSGFTGRVGVTAAAATGQFAEGENGGELFSDNPSYAVEGTSLIVAPLALVSVDFDDSEKVFPTTPLESLKSRITLEGVNLNGVPYIGNIYFSLSGDLSLGRSTVELTATGQGGEEVKTSLMINVVKPTLLSLTAEYEQSARVYFDSSLLDLIPDLTVYGEYDDGITRSLLYTSFTQPYDELYITDKYVLIGDLSVREEDRARVTVVIGGVTADFTVAISRHVLSAADITVVPVTMLQGGVLRAESFVPDLPEGIGVSASVAGEELVGSALEPGSYEVQLSFTAIDGENYEIAGTRTASLTVNRNRYIGETDSGEFGVTREGGIPPQWEFEVRELPNDRPRLDSGSEILQTFELTLFAEGAAKEELTVRLPLSKSAAGKERLSLYTRGEDGSLEAVEFSRDGEFIVFSASDLVAARYYVAAESGFAVYLGLTIAFGILCVAGAGILLWYIFCKRKIS